MKAPAASIDRKCKPSLIKNPEQTSVLFVVILARIKPSLLRKPRLKWFQNWGGEKGVVGAGFFLDDFSYS